MAVSVAVFVMTVAMLVFMMMFMRVSADFHAAPAAAAATFLTHKIIFICLLLRLVQSADGARRSRRFNVRFHTT